MEESERKWNLTHKARFGPRFGVAVLSNEASLVLSDSSEQVVSTVQSWPNFEIRNPEAPDFPLLKAESEGGALLSISVRMLIASSTGTIKSKMGRQEEITFAGKPIPYERKGNLYRGDGFSFRISSKIEDSCVNILSQENELFVLGTFFYFYWKMWDTG